MVIFIYVLTEEFCWDLVQLSHDKRVISIRAVEVGLYLVLIVCRGEIINLGIFVICL